MVKYNNQRKTQERLLSFDFGKNMGVYYSMGDNEVRRYVKKIEQVAEKINESPTRSQHLLQKAGICSSTGELKSLFKAIKKTS